MFSISKVIRFSTHASRIHTRIGLIIVCALLLNLSLGAQYYPMNVPPGGVIDSSEEDGGEQMDPNAMMMAMRRGMNPNDPAMQPKTDLGKKIMQIDFTREPGAVLAAR